MDTALKALLLVSFLGLGGCAGLGTFTGAAVREASRPEIVYAQPEPYYYRSRWHRRGWW
jgi:hypothetical protein